MSNRLSLWPPRSLAPAGASSPFPDLAVGPKQGTWAVNQLDGTWDPSPLAFAPKLYRACQNAWAGRFEQVIDPLTWTEEYAALLKDLWGLNHGADPYDVFAWKVWRITSCHPAVHGLPWPVDPSQPRKAAFKCFAAVYPALGYVWPNQRVTFGQVKAIDAALKAQEVDAERRTAKIWELIGYQARRADEFLLDRAHAEVEHPSSPEEIAEFLAKVAGLSARKGLTQGNSHVLRSGHAESDHEAAEGLDRESDPHPADEGELDPGGDGEAVLRDANHDLPLGEGPEGPEAGLPPVS